MGRPLKENSLTPDDVVQAAIVCLDQAGESGLGVNAVARQLGVKPPAIYKHLNGNAGLRRAVALAIWRDYLADCQRQMADLDQPQVLLKEGARLTRQFARRHPSRYHLMMHYPMQPSDPEEAAIMQQALGMFQQSLNLYNLSQDALIDAMRMVNAAIYGFIMREQQELMTLGRSPDQSYEVMINALIAAIESMN